MHTELLHESPGPMTSNVPDRQSHAHLDVAYRRRKAEKIIRILELQGPICGLSVLEVGAGSGVISATLADRVGPKVTVTAVDVVDARRLLEGYTFVPVQGVRLPFADASFDVVVANHVIEHVGDRVAQRTHLSEIARVLRHDGFAYLAVPNRWALIEPHFHLWFLSWLPRPLRSPYLRFLGKGQHYDCEPPGPLRIRSMIHAARLSHKDVAHLAIGLIADIEGGALPLRVAWGLPDSLLKAFSFV